MQLGSRLFWPHSMTCLVPGQDCQVNPNCAPSQCKASVVTGKSTIMAHPGWPGISHALLAALRHARTTSTGSDSRPGDTVGMRRAPPSGTARGSWYMLVAMPGQARVIQAAGATSESWQRKETRVMSSQCVDGEEHPVGRQVSASVHHQTVGRTDIFT